MSKRTPKELLEMREDTGRVVIDFSLVPDHVRDELAAATLESVSSFLQQPGGREKLDALIEARKGRQKV